jgi:hypothetical protein
MSEYIYSLDYENLGFFINNSTLPKDEKILLTEHNKKVWREQDQEIYIPITSNE